MKIDEKLRREEQKKLNPNYIEESDVAKLENFPDLPPLEPGPNAHAIQTLAQLKTHMDKVFDGIPGWTGPYVDDYRRLFRPGAAPESALPTDPTHKHYVGPLFDGLVPTCDRFVEDESGYSNRMNLFHPWTPHRVKQRVTELHLAYVRMSTATALLANPEALPVTLSLTDELRWKIIKSACDVRNAIARDLEKQEKLLPALQRYFCAYGPDSRKWKDEEAVATLRSWVNLVSWNNLQSTPIYRFTLHAAWTHQHPPLAITIDQLISEGFSPRDAHGCWRVLRSEVSSRNIPNTYWMLLAAARAVLLVATIQKNNNIPRLTAGSP